jgi:ubiquinone/menaquinone biosynthesis C-methylase UbiE
MAGSQYKDDSNLAARQRMYRFATGGGIGWYPWVFSQIQAGARASILEIGAGNAMLWRECGPSAPPGWTIALSDLSPGMLGGSREALHGQRSYSFALSDACRLPWADESFDVVLANHMLYHVPDRPAALAEIRRVLKPGGRLYAATNGARHLHQFKSLIERFVPWRQVEIEMNGATAAFTLENGGEQLRPWFAEMRMIAAPDSMLLVTEAQAILDYARSMDCVRRALAGAAERDFLAAVAEKIAAEGAFRIDLSRGLFLAAKPANGAPR